MSACSILSSMTASTDCYGRAGRELHLFQEQTLQRIAVVMSTGIDDVVKPVKEFVQELLLSPSLWSALYRGLFGIVVVVVAWPPSS